MPQFVRNSRLRILPSGLRGSSSRISSRSGSLNVAMSSSRRYATISSSVTAASGRGTTTAQARSPSTSSG